MEEVITQLKEKAGLTDEQAVKSIQIMKDFILSKVPPMFSGFVDNFFVDGNSAGENDSFMP